MTTTGDRVETLNPLKSWINLPSLSPGGIWEETYTHSENSARETANLDHRQEYLAIST